MASFLLQQPKIRLLYVTCVPFGLSVLYPLWHRFGILLRNTSTMCLTDMNKISTLLTTQMMGAFESPPLLIGLSESGTWLTELQRFLKSGMKATQASHRLPLVLMGDTLLRVVGPTQYTSGISQKDGWLRFCADTGTLCLLSNSHLMGMH